MGSILTFSRLDGLEPGREELVEREIRDVWGEVADPDAVVFLSGHQAGGVVVQLVPDGLEESSEPSFVGADQNFSCHLFFLL